MLRIKNILQHFEEFKEMEEKNKIMTEREILDLQSKYVDLNYKYKEIAKNNEKQKQKEYLMLNNGITFETELLKQFDIDLNYIFSLITQYTKENNTIEEINEKLKKMLNASIEFRNKDDLFYDFSKLVKDKKIDCNSMYDEWINFIDKRKCEELDSIIEANNLNKNETYKYIRKVFESKGVREFGTDIDRILPKMATSTASTRYQMKLDMYEKIIKFFDRFFTISTIKF